MKNTLRRMVMVVASILALSLFASAQDAYLGDIYLVGFNFAPRGWAECNGQLLSIAQNEALFSLLGTTYGGDGITTFALPNLNDRIAVGAGQEPGLANYELGQAGGESSHTLSVSEMPMHVHTMRADADSGTAASPAGNFPALSGAGAKAFSMTPAGSMAATGVAGGSQPHNNMMPYLGVKFVIAVEGIYPSRNEARPATTHK